MKTLNIGSIQIPISVATKTIAILAKRGAGKTYTAGVVAEELAEANVPFVVFDPIDVWWGLRLDKDGKGKGLPVVVFGLHHADIQLTRDMGRQIAQAVVKQNISCVISTFGMPKVAQRHLIAEFAEELLNINNTPRHVFIEEAHEFVPQRVQAGMGKCFSAVEALVVMGRNRGIGVTLINQRASTINKDVLTQLDTLLAFRLVAPQDRKALRDWVDVKSAEGDFDAFWKSLPTLDTGKGWIWSPEFMGVFEKISIRKRKTFHPDREKIGTNFVMPELHSQDIDSFINSFNASLQKEEVVKKKAEKKETKKEVKEHKEYMQSPQPRDDGFIPQGWISPRELEAIKNDYDSQLIEKDIIIRKANETINKVRSIVGAGETNITSDIEIRGVSIKAGMVENLPPYEKSIMNVIMKYPRIPFTKQQLAQTASKSGKSSTFEMAISRLVKLDLIQRKGKDLLFTPF
jgi:hypothetical protein